jgi:hypothetical protein
MYPRRYNTDQLLLKFRALASTKNYAPLAFRTNAYFVVDCVWNVMAHAQKPDFVFRRNGRVHLNQRGASVQSTAGSRGVRTSGSNAGYTMFRGSVKSTGYPLHSPVSPSLPLPCVTVCHQVSNALYQTLHFFQHTGSTFSVEAKYPSCHPLVANFVCDSFSPLPLLFCTCEIIWATGCCFRSFWKNSFLLFTFKLIPEFDPQQAGKNKPWKCHVVLGSVKILFFRFSDVGTKVNEGSNS